METENAQILGVSASLSGRRWESSSQHDATAQTIARQHGVPDILSRILAARGVNAERCMGFLNPTLRETLPDPSRLAGMEKAARRMRDAIHARETIAIFGDYDADGVTSAAILQKYLAEVGAPAEIFLPDRFHDGYGLNRSALRNLRDKGCSLLVTVDCGAADGDLLAEASSWGLSSIVLDHHPAAQPPKGCHAMVNPNCPPDESGLGYLSAAGLAFLFLVAVNRRLRDEGARPESLPDLRESLDLVALGTVCDVAPLIGVNRTFVMRGLDRVSRGGNKGLAALLRASGSRGAPSAQTFSFLLGPRINAAGRLGHADMALRLLTSQSDEEADLRAKELGTLNRQRRAMEEAMTMQATASLEARFMDRNDMPSFLLAASREWHLGVVGIVAARLRDRYRRPAAVVAIRPDGKGVGSARSLAGVHVGDLVREAWGEGIVIRGGGHAAAAGFTVEESRLKDLEAFFEEKASSSSAGNGGEDPLLIDAVLRIEGATPDLYAQIEKAGPYGKGNPEPCLALSDARAAYIQAKAGGHLRCRFEADSGASLWVMAFRAAGTPLAHALETHRGGLFHIAGHMQPSWSGGVELLLEDAALAI